MKIKISTSAKNNEISNRVLGKNIADTQEGLNAQLSVTNAQLKELRGRAFILKKFIDDPNEKEEKVNQYMEELTEVESQIVDLETLISILTGCGGTYQLDITEKNFDKYKTFTNIRELLKKSDYKIGQIEKEAGCQPGYMSRLDKPGNSSEPSIEFLVTAAKMLNISLDVLVSKDLAELTPTELYMVSFIEKLQRDTVADKLEWQREKDLYLNNLECDINGYVDHPLFGFHEFYEGDGTDYSNLVRRVSMESDSFGYATHINGDCFHLKMKNNSILYVMNLCKPIFVTGDKSAFAKEIWMYQPGVGCNFLISSKNEQCGDLVQILYDIISQRMTHPQIKKDVKSVIDAFMNDDFSNDDDENDGLPFH